LDGHPLPLDEDESTQGALQVALAVDINGLTVRNAGGQSGYVELTGTLLDLVEANLFTRGADWLAAYQLQGDQEPQAVQTWTQEPNLIFNSIVGNRPAEVNDAPLNSAALTGLLSEMASVADAAALPRVLLLFSTGAPDLDIEPVVAAAQAQRVAIHIVELLDGAAAPQSDTLQQLAVQSGGHYTALSSPDQSGPVGDVLKAARTVRLLQARADTATPQRLGVVLTLPDNSTVEAAAPDATFADLTIAPATLALAAPTTPVDWAALTAATGTAAPHLPIALNIDWPDGHPRQLLQVTYTLRGPGDFAQQIIRTEAPFDEANLPVADLQDGDYTLTVAALDELALEAEPVDTTIQFTNLPAAATGSSANSDAPTVDAQSVAPAATVAPTALVAQPPASAAAPADGVQIPGLPVTVPRALLVWSLPVLLLLIGYLIYSERRDRRRPQDNAAAATPAQFAAAPSNDARYALRTDARPQAGQRYQLKTNEKNPTSRYAIEDEGAAARVPVSRGRAVETLQEEAPASLFEVAEEPSLRQEAASFWGEDEALVWDDEDAAEDEITVAPPRMEDEEATYRTQDVQRPVIGHLVRTTSDPNLPKELPIYGLTPGPGELRQIHIGRHSKHNTVVINDKRVSREHAVIVQRDGRLYLRDNASTAGTFLNWKRLNPGEELLLRHNDLISFGEIAYEFRAHGEDEATIRNG
jgi:hypothetical protein